MRPEKTRLWVGAAVTAAAAVFFARVESVKNEDTPVWHLAVFFWPDDLEGAILVPLIVVLTIVLFALLGGWA
jgi:hypothetical protein